MWQSPTLGAHTHARAHPCPWGLGGHGCDVINYRWVWASIGFVRPCIQLQIGIKLLGCREYTNQEALWAKPSTMNDVLFVRSTKTWCRRVIHITQFLNTHAQFKYHGWAHVMLWVGMGRCSWLWCGYGYKFEGKCWALVCGSIVVTSNLY